MDGIMAKQTPNVIKIAVRVVLAGLFVMLVASSMAGKGSVRDGNERGLNVDGVQVPSLDPKIYVTSNAQLAAVASRGSGTQASPYVIENKVIDAAGSGDPIFLMNTNAYVLIQNCTLYGSVIMGGHGGLVLRSCTNVNATGNRMYQNDMGIYVYQSQYNTFIKNNLTLNKGGINFQPASNHNTVIGNRANNNTQYGIEVWYSDFTNVTGNTAMYNDMGGICNYGGNDNTFVGNVLSYNPDGYFQSYGTRSTITANTMTYNTNGISLDRGANNLFSGNNVSRNKDGIYIDFSTGNTFSNNVVDHNTEYGVYVFRDNLNNSIVGNNITYCTSHGVYLYESNTTWIAGNNIYHNGQYGINLYASNTNTITNNRFAYNVAGSIQIQSGTGNNVYGNFYTPAQVTGLVATGGNKQATLTWSAPGDGGSPITSYKVFRRLPPGAYIFIGTNTSTTGYLDTNLGNGLTYYYMVSAENAVGAGTNSSAASTTTWNVPAQVTGLVATGGNQQATLTWTAPAHRGSPITAYNVYRRLPPGAYAFIGTNTSTTGFTDTGLANGTTYYYMVSAISAVGAGANSSAAMVNTWSVPGQVTGLVAAGGNQQVSLSWNEPYPGGTAITQYNIYRSNTGPGPYMFVGSNTTLRGYVDVNLANGTNYYYKVSAVNVMGAGTNSSFAIATTWNVPGQVTGLVATGGYQQVSLSWSAPANGGTAITRYNVYRSDTVSGSYVFVGINTTVRGYVDTNRANGTQYFYMVSAANIVGAGANSSAVSATTWQVPSQVTVFSVTPGNGSVRLTWSAPYNGGTSISGYRVYWSDDNVTFSQIVLSVVATYLHSGLTNGQVYYHKVAAVNIVGEGTCSIGLEATPATTPSAPAVVNATGGNKVVMVGWGAAYNGGAPILAFNVYRASTVNGIYTFIGTNTSSMGYLDTNRANGVTYYYKVAATNIMGTGAISEPANATTWNVPAQVTGVVATGCNRQSNLTWTAPANRGSPITAYNVYRRLLPGTFIFVGTNTSATGFTDTSLAIGTTYNYVVSAINIVGAGTNSTIASATTWNTPGQVTGIVATGGNQQVSLSWSAPANGGAPILGYNVFRSIAVAGTYLFTGSNTSTTGFLDVNLANGTQYFYKVSALNVVGAGINSSSTSAVTWNVPGQVTSISGVAGKQQITLSWSAPSNGGAAITEYNVYRSVAVAGTYLFVGTNTTATGFIDTGLADETQYFYKVSAENTIGEGACSPVGSATTWGMPSQVTGLAAAAGNQQVALSWSPPSNGGSAITLYNVYRSNAIAGLYLLVGTNTSTTGFLDTSLANWTQYFYKVSAVNAIGSGANSTAASVTTWNVPSQVTSLVATPGERNVILSWTIPADGGTPITSFEIYRDNVLIHTAAGSASSYTDGGLVNGRSYTYTVCACNVVGNGPYSDEVTATLPASNSPSAVPGFEPLILSCFMIIAIIAIIPRKLRQE